jgi:hypothetical protein
VGDELGSARSLKDKDPETHRSHPKQDRGEARLMKAPLRGLVSLGLWPPKGALGRNCQRPIVRTSDAGCEFRCRRKKTAEEMAGLLGGGKCC